MTTSNPSPTSSDPSSVPGLIRSIAHRLAGDEVSLPIEGHLAPFTGATGWLNSEPLTPEGLRGRVVLVDFWTYTCINWLRTLPYRRAWAAKYADAGLTIVGVHTPEFGFEKDRDNIVAAGRRSTRSSIRSRSTAITASGAPSTTISGRRSTLPTPRDGIRYHHFGEGEYAMTEMVIQQLLLDAGAQGLGQDLVDVDPQGLEVAADWRTLQSPETYAGYRQATGFAQEDVARFDESVAYTLPARLRLNDWALAGQWTVAGHASVANAPGARIAFQFHARDVNLVMGPATRGTSIPFRVFLDGQPAGNAVGTRRGRRWHRDRRRAADVPADPPAGRDRRAPVRDRVPRRRCRGLLLHVRLRRSPGRPTPAAYPPSMFRMAVGHSDDVDLVERAGDGLRGVRRRSRGRDPDGRPPDERLGGRPPVRDRSRCAPATRGSSSPVRAAPARCPPSWASARTPWHSRSSRRTRSTSSSGSGATLSADPLAAARRAVDGGHRQDTTSRHGCASWCRRSVAWRRA